MSAKVSIQSPLAHYQWGDGCDGWNFVEEPALSVKQERMPAGTSEALHYHQYAQQFFFILKGSALFEIEDERIIVNEMEGIHIPAGSIASSIIQHRPLNLSSRRSHQPWATGSTYKL